MSLPDPNTRISVPATVLLVEDEQSLREDISEELQAAGYTVLPCEHGGQAMAILDTQRPDLILCDIGLPVMDGYDLLKTLQAQRPDLADAPFIFLTAQASQAQAVQGKRAGADDYLVKPIDFDLLLATIEARLRQVRRLRETSVDPAALPETIQQPIAQMQLALDSIAICLMLLDADGRLTFVNRMAAESLGLQAGQTLPELVVAIGLREPERLSQLIRQSIDIHQESARCLALTRAGGDARDLLITVCSLDADTSADTPSLATRSDGRPVVSITISDPAQRTHPPVALLNELYHLTPAEAKVAWAFAQGKRSEDIAAAFEISPTTVAFHKRNIFLKTQTNRQADLIALMLSLPIV